MILLLMKTWESAATNIFYVLSDNLTNATCLSQACTTLSQYLSDDGTLPVVANVEYHFLPGEHHVPDNMVLKSLHNFSIVGIVSNASSPVVLVGCFHPYVIKIYTSHNVNIRNITFKRCYNPQLQFTGYFTSLYLYWCYSCVIENVTFSNFGIVGEYLIGQSYLNEIYITHTKGSLCQGITLAYIDVNQSTDDDEYHLLMSKLHITGIGKCFDFNIAYKAGIYILIGRNTNNLVVTISNSIFKGIHSTAVHFHSKCATNNILLLNNCKFDSVVTVNGPVVQAELHLHNNFIAFKNCTFKKNDGYYNHFSVISINIVTYENVICRSSLVNHSIIALLTNIHFEECQFTINHEQLLKIDAKSNEQYKPNLYIIGPTSIAHNFISRNDLISIQNMVVTIYGKVIVSHNYALYDYSIFLFVSSTVIFFNKIIFKYNHCAQVIFLKSQPTYIKAMEDTNITFISNKCSNKLIEVEVGNFRYNFCLFQFMTSQNELVTSTKSYSIKIFNTSTTQQKECSFIYYHLNTHCQWLSTAAFQGYDSEIVNHKIIQIDDQKINYHRICLCNNNGSYDCSKDMLGTVYPGQVLQVGLCTPCNNNTFILYVETYDSLQTNSSCRITNQAGILNTISNYNKLINYTIVSEAYEMCKLFLTISSYKQQYAYEVFYVKLLPCPVGFTLQGGACDCDPILTKYVYIDKCYIDQSTIRRPANTWITAHTQTNNTNYKYLLSDCPMDYCLPYSSNVNLLYPDHQCQFNRTGIVCSRCQQPLSMVFGSSRCMKCTNIYILITIIVIVAGIILVLSLYLLNLTVTKGTINGIVLYANIISINDSVFLINSNTFAPLKLFISFTNLDLGIETCFYDGMDGYAKMWLQLFFPIYLIIIAIFIIIASRYSSRIFRLTYTRSLPVLATLFLLSYTGVLRTVLTVLFSYSTITHLPSGHQQTVWSVDASVPLFGVKFIILFVICLVLFLLLIPFNITLLFTRYLSKFRIINHFKPILDALQGSYKDKYYYWVALNVILRILFFALYGFKSKLRLLIATMILIVFSTYHGYICPNTTKVVNIQELLLLINLTIMYAVSYYGTSDIFSLVTNVMITLAFVQFSTIVLYHFLTYTCRCDVMATLRTLREKAMRLYGSRPDDSFNDIALLDLVESTHNFKEYQD